MSNNIKNYKPAAFFIEELGIKKPTFFQRVDLRNIKYKQIELGQRLYSLKDWNKKCPEDQAPLDK
jgi:hypothetical protein